MKKLIAFVLITIFITVVFWGCNTETVSNQTPNPSADPTTPGINNEDAITRTPNVVGVFPPVASEQVKIGVIYNSDPNEVSSDSYAHDQGIEDVKEAFSLKNSQIIKKTKVSETNDTAIKKAIKSCIDSGCNIIFGTSAGYAEIMGEYAEEYPNVIFSNAGGNKSNDTNYNNYYGDIYQAWYLSGIVAGLKTKTNKIGFVASFGVKNNEITVACNAFAMGENSVNTKAKVHVRVTNSKSNPEEEHFAAVALIEKNCDVIAQHCGSSIPQVTAQNKKVFGIGYNADMRVDAPKAVLTSVVWNWSIYYRLAVFNVIAGEWSNENYRGSLGEGFVDITPLSDFCAKGTDVKIEEAKAKFGSGEWDVFDGEILTNKGEEKTSTHYSDINWYFKNIIVE
ncbi:MAG: BMP family ABC transporter substrate-binding protein [Clostridiales bacterium]|nr:BMP family ABC transporter substrate-binding protein [Clostridiales bacterium]